jgi:hypothetical protein
MDVGTCVAQNCSSACISGSGNGMGGNGAGTGGGSNNGTGATTSGTGGSSNGTGASSSGTGATGNTGGGTCADLNTCCGKITQADLKSACTSAYSQAKGNDSLCGTIYQSLSDFCP